MTVYKSRNNSVRTDSREENIQSRNKRAEFASERSRFNRDCNHAGGSETYSRQQEEMTFSNRNSDDFVLQDGEQYALLDQESAELIWVKESCKITVNTTDTQAGVSLLAGLQLAIT